MNSPLPFKRTLFLLCVIPLCLFAQVDTTFENLRHLGKENAYNMAILHAINQKDFSHATSLAYSAIHDKELKEFNIRTLLYALLSRDEMKEADKLLYKASQINPMYYKEYDLLAKHYYNLKNYEKTIETSTLYLNSVGYNKVLLSIRAVSYRYQKRYEEALIDYSTLISRNESISLSLRGRANVYRLNGMLEKAIEDYERAYSIDSTDLKSLSGLSYVYFDMGKTLKARKILKEVEDRDPSQKADCLYTFACFSALRDKPRKACNYLSQAIEEGYDNFRHLQLDPDLDPIRDEIAYKQIASKYNF